MTAAVTRSPLQTLLRCALGSGLVVGVLFVGTTIVPWTALGADILAALLAPMLFAINHPAAFYAIDVFFIGCACCFLHKNDNGGIAKETAVERTQAVWIVRAAVVVALVALTMGIGGVFAIGTSDFVHDTTNDDIHQQLRTAVRDATARAPISAGAQPTQDTWLAALTDARNNLMRDVNQIQGLSGSWDTEHRRGDVTVVLARGDCRRWVEAGDDGFWKTIAINGHPVGAAACTNAWYNNVRLQTVPGAVPAR